MLCLPFFGDHPTNCRYICNELGNWDWNWYECEERGGGENGKWIDSGIESKQDEDKSNGVEEKGWGGHQT